MKLLNCPSIKAQLNRMVPSSIVELGKLGGRKVKMHLPNLPTADKLASKAIDILIIHQFLVPSIIDTCLPKSWNTMVYPMAYPSTNDLKVCGISLYIGIILSGVSLLIKEAIEDGLRSGSLVKSVQSGVQSGISSSKRLISYVHQNPGETVSKIATVAILCNWFLNVREAHPSIDSIKNFNNLNITAKEALGNPFINSLGSQTLSSCGILYLKGKLEQVLRSTFAGLQNCAKTTNPTSSKTDEIPVVKALPTDEIDNNPSQIIENPETNDAVIAENVTEANIAATEISPVTMREHTK